MSGTSEGNQRTANTLKMLYGADYYSVIGRSGGSAKVKKGFAVTGNASEAGRKGGKAKRKKVVDKG